MNSIELAKSLIEDPEQPNYIAQLAGDFLEAVECLEFYADKETWTGSDQLVGGPEEPDVEYCHPAMDDEGKMAKKFLNKLEPK